MSITFDRLRMAAAVLLCAGLLAWSGFLEIGAAPVIAPSVTAEQEAAVRQAVAILRTGRTPLVDVDTCDGVKSLIPDQVTAEDGLIKLTAPSTRDVIICFRDDIDYGDALMAAATRKLRWQAGIGGDRIVVFASSQARFMAVARENHILLRHGDLHPFSPLMANLKGSARSRLQNDVWLIQPGPESEALFGPYVDLTPGDYRVSVTFAPVTANSCGDLAQLKVIAAATADSRQRILAGQQPLAMQPQAGADCELTGQFDFSVPMGGGRAIETPLWIASARALNLIGYDIQPR